MAQRMACVVLADVLNCNTGRHIDVDMIVSSVHAQRSLNLAAQDVIRVVEKMVDWGHRYRNLEIALGKGICLVLGCDLSESQ
jgi:hypothetical protein